MIGRACGGEAVMDLTTIRRAMPGLVVGMAIWFRRSSMLATAMIPAAHADSVIAETTGARAVGSTRTTGLVHSSG